MSEGSLKSVLSELLFLFGSYKYLLGLAVLGWHCINTDHVARRDVGNLGVIDHLAVNLQDIFLFRCGGIQLERDGNGIFHSDGLSVLLAGVPIGHGVDDTQGFGI